MGIEAALHRHGHGEFHGLGLGAVERPVDGVEQLWLAQHAGQVAPEQRPLEQGLGRGIGKADALLAIDQQQGIGQMRQHALGLGSVRDQPLLALAPDPHGVDQPWGEAAAQGRIPARRGRSGPAGGHALGIIGQNPQMGEMAPEHRPEPEQQEQPRDDRRHQRQMGDGDEAGEDDENRCGKKAESGEQAAERRARRHRRPIEMDRLPIALPEPWRDLDARHVFVIVIKLQ